MNGNISAGSCTTRQRASDWRDSRAESAHGSPGTLAAKSNPRGDTTMRFSKEMTVAVLSILISSAAIAHASDTCKNVKFKFTNKHDSGGMIEVHQIKYFNKANGEWKTEGLKDVDCRPGKDLHHRGRQSERLGRRGADQVSLHLSLQGHEINRQLVRLRGGRRQGARRSHLQCQQDLRSGYHWFHDFRYRLATPSLMIT